MNHLSPATPGTLRERFVQDMTVRGFTDKVLVGLRGGRLGSCDQGCKKGAEQGFAASARVVHELKEAEVVRQFVLRDAAVRSQPGT